MSEETPKKARGGRKPGSRNRAKPEPSYTPQIRVSGVTEKGKAFSYDCHALKEDGIYFVLTTYGAGFIERRSILREGTLVREPWQPPQPQAMQAPRATSYGYQQPQYTVTSNMNSEVGAHNVYGNYVQPVGPPPSFQTNLMPTTSEALVTAAANNGGFSAGMLDS